MKVYKSLPVLFCIIASLASLASGQTPAPAADIPTSATDVTRDQIMATLKKAAMTDQQVRVVDMGPYNIAVGIATRAQTGKPSPAISHDQITEVYYITEGSGTLVTGGKMVNPRRAAPDSAVYKLVNGPTSLGSALEGGVSRRVTVGDVIIIPPKVGHWFTTVEGDRITYLIFRVDSDHVLPAGFIDK
jgi:mannose-6-phosphate isomerase-like protein (cupin superfamily)